MRDENPFYLAASALTPSRLFQNTADVDFIPRRWLCKEISMLLMGLGLKTAGEDTKSPLLTLENIIQCVKTRSLYSLTLKGFRDLLSAKT